MSRLDLRIDVSLPGSLRRGGLPRPEPDASVSPEEKRKALSKLGEALG